ncbi:unnamed protein product, partial [Musa textilis]
SRNNYLPTVSSFPLYSYTYECLHSSVRLSLRSMQIVHALPMCLSLFAFVSVFSYPRMVYCRETPHRNTNQLQTYVVQLQAPTASLDADGLNIWHKSFLPVSDDDSDRRLVHSYSHVFTGFSARLTEEEAKSVANKEGFLRGFSTPFDEDPLAIGAFGAVTKGIFVSCAAGNSGPVERTLSNEAPWLLTVAASTVDRSQRATVKLGDGQKFNGESLDQYPTSSASLLTLFHTDSDSYCKSLNSSQVEGKVVACSVYRTPSYTANLVKAAGGVGVILISTIIEGGIILDSRCNFPATKVSNEDGARITAYATSATKPTVSITYDGTVIGTSPAPVVAFFSSRGPSTNGPGILKPDVSGPGVNILAAWPSDVEGGDGRMDGKTFNFGSGTSMATPHLSGVAALLKSLHPGWSPAAIKSAIMTASDDKDRDGNQIMDQRHTTAGFFAMGAGHVNPSKAADPGLVYDLGIDDYIAYLCGKFGNTGARVIVRDTTVDCGKINNITESELNYPSIVVAPKNGTAATVKRTVTNVGQANSRYTVEVEVPTTVSVTVSPPSLSFSEVNQKKSFLVTAKWTTAGLPTRNAEGNLKWVSDTRVVRSPLVVSIL